MRNASPLLCFRVWNAWEHFLKGTSFWIWQFFLVYLEGESRKRIRERVKRWAGGRKEGGEKEGREGGHKRASSTWVTTGSSGSTGAGMEPVPRSRPSWRAISGAWRLSAHHQSRAASEAAKHHPCSLPCPLAQQHQGSEDSPQPEGGSTCLPHLQPKARSCKGIRGAPGGMNKQRHACLSVSFLLSDTHCSATWKLFQIQHIQTFLLFTRCIVVHRMIKP